MSVKKRAVAIDCDGPAAGSSCPDFAGVVRRGTAAYIREDLHEQGWATALPGSKDRCPSCRERDASDTGSNPPAVERG